MKFLGFDGREHSLQVTDYIIYQDDIRVKSSLHLRAREILIRLFPCDKVLEEVRLPGSGKESSLVADFFIPSKCLVVEVQGEQHNKYTSFFHEDKFGFIRAKMRDSNKKEWCRMNNIDLVELPYNESDEEWRTKIELR